MSMVVKLPFPDSALFPNRKNGRSHFATNDVKQKQRDGAYYITKAAVGAWKPQEGLIPLSIVFVPPSGHNRDLDNCLAAAKAQIDGIAMALGVDDKRFRPILLEMTEPAKPGAMIVGIGVTIVSSMEIGV